MVIRIYSNTTIGSLTFGKKIEKMKIRVKSAMPFFLTAVLVLAVATVSWGPSSSQAQLSSDTCERFGILCKAQTDQPSSTASEEETPSSEEETSTNTPQTEQPSSSEEETITAATVGGADFRAIFLTYVDGTALRNLYNQELDSNDLIVMHLGLNQAPPTTALNNLDAITSVPDSRKGLEFFSLPEIKKYAPMVAQRGWGFISYDLEGVSPDSEEADPVTAVKKAKQYADEANVDLMIAPSQRIARLYAAGMAPYVDRFHLQSQSLQDNDATCTAMRDWINTRIASIEKAKPSLADEITSQVTLTNNAASGKTIYQTVKDCMDKPLTEGDGKADGLSIWFGGTQFKDGTYSQLLKYFEGKYS